MEAVFARGNLKESEEEIVPHSNPKKSKAL